MTGSRKLSGLFAAVIVIGILLCLWLIATRTTTTTEALLLSVVLTILSVLGSWLASRFYSEASFNASLRVFALKAAEKVNNLSNELDRLTVFLQQELDTQDYADSNEALLARDLRIEGAVHIIGTLKSVNDRSLSDWQGVIGEEINAQREEREEREDELRELLERVENLYSEQVEDLVSAQGADNAALRAELESVRAEIRLLMTQSGGVPVRRTKIRRPHLELPCPACNATVQFRQKEKTGSFKAMSCRGCGQKLFSTFTGTQFVLKIRKSTPEHVQCPTCQVGFAVELDNYPYGPSRDADCPSCGNRIRASRSLSGVTVKIVANNKSAVPAPLSEELISKVKELMPAQPWPKGASKEVAKKLDIPNGQVSRALHDLVRRGDFKVQIDGRLYEPIPAGDVSDNTD